MRDELQKCQEELQKADASMEVLREKYSYLEHMESLQKYDADVKKIGEKQVCSDLLSQVEQQSV